MSHTTILLNTHTSAVSQFFNHPANSACVFNGELIFATDSGVYKSAGDFDGEDNIDAHFTLPQSNFGYNGQKSLRSMVVGGYINGSITATVSDEKGASRDYISKEMDQTDGCKLALRSDQRSRYFTTTISNVDGADFSIDTVDVTFIPGSERRR